MTERATFSPPPQAFMRIASVGEYDRPYVVVVTVLAFDIERREYVIHHEQRVYAIDTSRIEWTKEGCDARGWPHYMESK